MRPFRAYPGSIPAFALCPLEIVQQSRTTLWQNLLH
jgi:hypothetical protein